VNEAAWKWIREEVVLAIHDEQIAEHGGLPGVREMALIQSAPARPRNAVAYGMPDAADLAAAYAYGLARNHPFQDGNKRTAFVVALVFLLSNGYELTVSDGESVATIRALAAGELSEEALAKWLRANMRER
jgi:death-on-curing protein